MSGPTKFKRIGASKTSPIEIRKRAEVKLRQPPGYFIHVDADRDGNIDALPADETWQYGKGKRGAIVLVNNNDSDEKTSCDDADSVINGSADRADVTPFEVRRSNTTTAKPGDCRLVMSVPDGGEQRIRIFDGDKAAEVIGPTMGARYEFPTADFTTRTFGIEGNVYPGADFDGLTRIKLEVLQGGAVMGSQTVAVRTAPWLVFNHADVCKHVYVVNALNPDPEWMLDNSNFRTDLLAALPPSVQLFEVESKYDIWMQDCMEFGFSSKPNTSITTVLRAPRDRDLINAPATLLAKDMGYTEAKLDAAGASTFDSTGNLECTPPILPKEGKSYPFGRLYFGDGTGASGKPMNPDFKAFLESQKSQKPIVIDTSWLTVGHVDEMMTFLPSSGKLGFTLLLASPMTAYELMLETVAKHPRADMLVGRENVVGMGRGGLQRLLTSGIEKLGAEALKNFNHRVQSRLNKTRQLLKKELGIEEADILDVPVLFHPRVDMARRQKAADLAAATADALTADMVNLLFVNGTCIVPKPFGPVAMGHDVFETYFEKKLTKLGHKTVFVDDWYDYHVQLGEIHCGTNTLRVPTRLNWWDYEP